MTGECKHISSSTTGLLLKNQLCNILDDDKSCRRRLAAPLSAAFLTPRRRNQTVFSGRRIARVTLHIVHKSQLMFRKCKSYQRVIPRPNFKILLHILIGKYVLLILMYPKVASNNPYYKSKICSKITVHKCQKSPS